MPVLYSTIDSSEHGDIEKKVLWSEDFIEIATRQLGTQRQRSFRLSSALVSAMMQHFHYDMDVLWRHLTEAVKYYDDRVIFSTQHIIFFREERDSTGRDAYRIYETTRSLENGDEWKLDFLVSVSHPFDLEIQVQLSPREHERKHIYRIEGCHLRHYFEKYCLSGLERRRNHLKSVSASLKAHSASTDEDGHRGSLFIETSLAKEDDGRSYVKRTNPMLNTLAEELFYDSETDQLYNSNIDLSRLEDYVESTEQRRESIVHAHAQRDPTLLKKRDTIAEEEEEEEEPGQDDENDEEEREDGEERSGNRREEGEVDQDISLVLPEEDSLIDNVNVGEHLIHPAADSTQHTDAASALMTAQPPPLHKYERYSSILMKDSGEENDLSLTHSSSSTDINAAVRKAASAVTSTTVAAQNTASGGESTRTRTSFAVVNGAKNNNNNNNNNTAGRKMTIHGRKSVRVASSSFSTSAVNSTTEKDSNAQPPSNAGTLTYRDMQQKFHNLNFFAQTFKYEQYRVSREDSLREEMEDAVRASYESAKLAKQEAMVLSRNPLHEVKRDFSFTPDAAKAFTVRQAASVRLEQRSEMSNRAIVDFLRTGCKLGRFLSHCSHYDCLAIAERAQLVEIDPPYESSKIHYALGVEFGDVIANVYVLLMGEIEIDQLDTLRLNMCVRSRENDEEDEDEDNELDEIAGNDMNARWQYIYNNPSLHVFTREKLRLGDVLGENVLHGEYGWTCRVMVLSSSSSSFDVKREGKASGSLESDIHRARVSLLRISLSALQQFVGRKGGDIEQAMVFFWKKTRLWNDISRYNKTVAQSSLFHAIHHTPSSQSQKSTRRNTLANALPETPQNARANARDAQNKRKAGVERELSTMNVVESARLRTYQAGAEIFVQGQPRVYLYVIKQGTATYFRDFPRDHIGLDVMPERVETVQSCAHALPFFRSPASDHKSNGNSNNGGKQTSTADNVRKNITSDDPHTATQRESSFGVIADGEEHDGGVLLSHDFSFMDSEDGGVIARIADQDERFLRDFAHESEKVLEHRKRRYSRFLVHKNTLIATTRCEVLVVPLSEIAKSLSLFRSLLQLVHSHYPMIMIDNAQVVKEYHERRRWETVRKAELLSVVERDKLSNRLLQEHIFCEINQFDSPKRMLLSDPTVLSPTRSRDYSQQMGAATFVAVPHAPQTPKSSRSAKRPHTAASRPVTTRGERGKDTSSLAAVPPSRPPSRSASAGIRPGASKKLLSKKPAASMSTNGVDVSLGYIDRFQSIIQTLAEKYDAENAEMLRILNQRVETFSPRAQSARPRSSSNAVSSPTSSRGGITPRRETRSRSKSPVQLSRDDLGDLQQSLATEGSALRPMQIADIVHRSLSPVQLTVQIPLREVDPEREREEKPGSRIIESPLSSRRGGISVQVRNVHDLALASEKYRTFSQSRDEEDTQERALRPEAPDLLSGTSPFSSHRKRAPEEISREDKEREKQLFSTMLFHAQHGLGTEQFATALSSNRPSSPQRPARKQLSPDDYAQIYKERAAGSPKQRFVSEFMRKSSLMH